jgi:hypothetical protein
MLVVMLLVMVVELFGLYFNEKIEDSKFNLNYD